MADDSSDNRALIRAYMKKTPYTVGSERAEAIDKFIAGKFDLVLMDIQMQSWTASKRLDDSRLGGSERAAAPIVALTASATGEAMHRTLEADATRMYKRSEIKRYSRDSQRVGSGCARRRSTRCLQSQEEICDRVIVEVDEDLSDLIPGFLTHKPPISARFSRR